MRILLFLLFPLFAVSQPVVQNLGSHYRISVATLPNNYNYPQPDSASLRITVICPASQTCEVSNIAVGQSVDYKMKGIVYVAVSVIWWRKNARISQTSFPTICGFFLNNVSCFQKI